MKLESHRLLEVFAVLKPNLSAECVDVTPTLYQELDSNYSGFKNHVLVSSFEFSDDWSTWELHPAGDEIVLLLSGSATLVLRTANGDVRVALTEPGTYVLVPRNTWHTAHTSEPTRMLFITPGEGTENRAEPCTD